MSLLSSTPYVPPRSASAIRNYKYRGADMSPIYKHVLTPLNNVLLQFIPLWVAPNTITLCGLLCTVVSHIALCWHCPSFRGDIPSWAIVLHAVMLFFYQTLDNLDGKQARRTGSSSALGLFFDHGIDAVNVTVMALSTLCVLQTGVGWKALAVEMAMTWGFYLNTWEEFYTGELILPVFNGPTEGILIVCLLCLFTANVGPAFWLSTATMPFPLGLARCVDGVLDLLDTARENLALAPLAPQVEATGRVEFQYNTVPVAFVMGVAFCTLVANFWNVFSFLRSEEGKRALSGGHETWASWRLHFPFTHALTRLLAFAFVTVFVAVWVAVSPTNVFARHPRILLWTLGLVFWKLCIHLMLAHMCDDEYRPFRRSLIPFFFLGLHTALHHLTGDLKSENETLLVLELFVIAFFVFVHAAFGVVNDLCKILDIHCFSIAKLPKHD